MYSSNKVVWEAEEPEEDTLLKHNVNLHHWSTQFIELKLQVLLISTLILGHNTWMKYVKCKIHQLKP